MTDTATFTYRLVLQDGESLSEELTAELPTNGNTMRVQFQQIIARRLGVPRIDVVITGRS
jgi:hypothetical protein